MPCLCHCRPLVVQYKASFAIPCLIRKHGTLPYKEGTRGSMGKKEVRMILTDICLGVAAVVLYSPGLLGWYPTDPSILKAGISILGGLGICYGLIKTNFLSNKALPMVEPEKVATADECIDLLQKVEKGPGMEKVCRDAVGQLMRVKKYRPFFDVLIAKKFPPGSLSYEKFHGAVRESLSTVVKNSATIALHMQMFDEEGFRRLSELIDSGRHKRDNIPDELQEEKYGLYKRNQETIRKMVELNEKILLNLDALSAELSEMDTKDMADDNSAVLEELTNLVEETQYYSS